MSNIFRFSDRRKPRDKITSENKVVSLGFTVTIPYFSTLGHMYALVGYRFGFLVSNEEVFFRSSLHSTTMAPFRPFSCLLNFWEVFTSRHLFSSIYGTCSWYNCLLLKQYKQSRLNKQSQQKVKDNYQRPYQQHKVVDVKYHIIGK